VRSWTATPSLRFAPPDTPRGAAPTGRMRRLAAKDDIAAGRRTGLARPAVLA
jgi:hypothetical protein